MIPAGKPRIFRKEQNQMEPPRKRQRLVPLRSFLDRVPSDILCCILPFMTMGSSAHLRRTCKRLRVMVDRFYARFKRSLVQHVEVFLQHILSSKKEFELFRTALIASRAMVSGSCILAALLDTPFDDIDIFVPVYRQGPRQVFSPVENFLFARSTSFRKATWTDRYHHNILKDIDGTKDYQVQNKSFQVILVYGKPLDTITKNFDFNVACNYYDGKQVVVSYPHAVAARHITLLPVQRPLAERFQYRWMKYTSRGFTFAQFNLRGFIAEPDTNDNRVMTEIVEYRRRCKNLYEEGVPYLDKTIQQQHYVM